MASCRLGYRPRLPRGVAAPQNPHPPARSRARRAARATRASSPPPPPPPPAAPPPPKLAELERTVGNADQPVHLEPEMGEHIAHLAVLALADRKHQPDIGALVTLQRRIDRTVFDVFDLD